METIYIFNQHKETYVYTPIVTLKQLFRNLMMKDLQLFFEQ